MENLLSEICSYSRWRMVPFQLHNTEIRQPSSQDEFVFEFEEDLSTVEATKTKFTAEIEEISSPTQHHKHSCGHGTDIECGTPPAVGSLIPISGAVSSNLSVRQLASSVPVTIPSKIKNQYSHIYFDDDTSRSEFIKPHELAAKTYQEVYLKTGLAWDVPAKKRAVVAQTYGK
eukprot:TRINITY_DN4899_c0_g1_i3.p1 TRINITY_DN4899_c0_g1~~TRINITY_DN4899_c0_g1_i3.p1  ORF type:complete len:173 (-),score=17.34 TRINITY_DN4899_c0_g1_i3:101-619(-)